MAFGLNQRQAAQQMSVASARKAIDVDRFCPEGVGRFYGRPQHIQAFCRCIRPDFFVRASATRASLRARITNP